MRSKSLNVQDDKMSHLFNSVEVYVLNKFNAYKYTKAVNHWQL